MQKRIVYILLIMSVLIMILNAVLLFKHTGHASQGSSQGSISLRIDAEPVCGNSVCDANESCSTCSADCGSCPVTEVPEAPSGGAGGGAVPVKKDFSVDKSIIKVLLKQGESFKTSVTIKNTEDSSQNFEVSLSPSLEGLVFLSEQGFSLQPGEEKIIDLTFVSSDETDPGVYTGNLKIKTIYQTKQIPIIYNIKSKMVLFDISLDIPPEYKEIFAGGNLLLEITLFNLGEVGKTNVSVEYIIKDFEGEVIVEKSEIVEVETQVSFSKMIGLPSTIKLGDYVAIAQARYDASVGSASEVFHVIDKERPEIIDFIKNKYFILILIIIIILMILFLIYEKRRTRDILKIQARGLKKIRKRIKKRIKKGGKIIGGEALRIKGKLDRQLGALENAREGGYISQSSYEKGKTRIKNLGKKIK